MCRHLAQQWAALLKDWAVLGSQSLELADTYQPALLPYPPLAFMPLVFGSIDAAAPVVTLALAATISQSPRPEHVRLCTGCHMMSTPTSSDCVADSS